MAVVVTLDGVVHDPDAPLLCADDLAAVRGDGVFETLLVRGGRARVVDAHLTRLAASAAMLDLPVPDPQAWRRAIDAAAAAWGPGAEGALRLVYTRGRESGSAPTAYVTVSPLAARIAAARADGISAVLLDRGLDSGARSRLPWLLAGAKTLSYAVNMAALRHAAGVGADDVVFVSSDGLVLEGPRSTVVIAVAGDDGRPCLLTPPPWYPILRGTTAAALFTAARDAGYDCDYRALRPADLFAAQGVWLLSSITLGARVHTLDGVALPPAPLAVEFAGLVDAAIGGR
ncbi:4-amino-4-deoxychorismate lyase [Mycolicibacterium fallax]|uniref:4-amino-4-deoxychorismate lyase n=1 Tax=Mycolicibacterium fallax TaxID=1793 RepID=A0A1X1R3S2_MYCFA|nr:4-amino-4-deoxychorismate lyase [Mycolicibacterium fallax]BBZ00059.1 4-amino-4-deoxychorismate lyase [Mycolicibacterium fallax]